MEWLGWVAGIIVASGGIFTIIFKYLINRKRTNAKTYTQTRETDVKLTADEQQIRITGQEFLNHQYETRIVELQAECKELRDASRRRESNYNTAIQVVRSEMVAVMKEHQACREEAARQAERIEFQDREIDRQKTELERLAHLVADMQARLEQT